MGVGWWWWCCERERERRLLLSWAKAGNAGSCEKKIILEKKEFVKKILAPEWYPS